MTTSSEKELIKTGVPQLDDMLGGGLARTTLSTLWIKPGLDGNPFAYQIAHSAAADSNNVFYLVNSKNPESVQADMQSFGFKADGVGFIDSYSALIGQKSTNPIFVPDPKSEDSIITTIQKTIKGKKNPVVIIDSLSTLIDLTGEEKSSALEQLKKLEATVLCLFTEWPYDPAIIKKIEGSIDTIISISSVEEKLFTKQYFGVQKLAGTKPKKRQVIPYRFTKPGGVRIYIPKVLVTGPFNAGKTSFIHSVSERAVSVDRLGTTIALDHGHVKYGDFTVDLFGTPGQERFDPVLKLLGGEALGVIVVLSATDPAGLPRAMDMMKKAQVYNLPVVFAANKADLRGALTPDQIRLKVDLDKKVEIIPLVAEDITKVQPGAPCTLRREDINKVLDALFGKLLKGGGD